MKKQIQHYYSAVRRISDANQTFMEMIKHPTNPLTNAELKALIAKRPSLWGRYKGFLGKLKD